MHCERGSTLKNCSNRDICLGASLIIEGCFMAYLYHEFCLNFTISLMCLVIIVHYFCDIVVTIFM